MSFFVDRKYRVRRNAEQEYLMSKLREAKIFTSYKDILMVSALVGFNNEIKEPILKPASDGVLLQFFNDNDIDLIDLIAYADTKSKEILSNSEKYKIFEEYANAGFPVLMSLLNISDDGTDLNRNSIIIKYFSLLISNSQAVTDVLDI